MNNSDQATETTRFELMQLTARSNGNMPADPVAWPSGDIDGGLTKREYMATAIMAGMMAQPNMQRAEPFQAVAQADALLLELAK